MDKDEEMQHRLNKLEIIMTEGVLEAIIGSLIPGAVFMLLIAIYTTVRYLFRLINS